MEIWKDVAGFDGFYQISNMGRVKSVNGIRSLSYTRDGYAKVRLLHDGKDKTYKVHRLVAEAFIPNTDNKETVNHKDGDKTNNKVENLEWADRSEQMLHAYILGLKKPVKTNRKLTPEQVEEIRRTYKRQSKEYGTVALGRKYGVHDSVIGKVVRGVSYV